jgi:hypothetical protein
MLVVHVALHSLCMVVVANADVHAHVAVVGGRRDVTIHQR